MSSRRGYTRLTTDDLKKGGTKDFSSMTKKELEKEKAKIEALLVAKSRKKTEDISPRLEMFYRGLASQFMLYFNHKLPPLYVLAGRKNKYLYNLIHQVLSYLDEWLERVLKRKPKRTECARLYVLYGELMIRNITDNTTIPTILRTVLQMYESFPAVFDRAFPDYIQSGLVEVVLKAKKQKLSDEDLI